MKGLRKGEHCREDINMVFHAYKMNTEKAWEKNVSKISENAIKEAIERMEIVKK